jgi:hypothetical protein
MKVKEIVSAYRVLGEAKVSNLEESEIKKVVLNRKAMRNIVEEFEAFLKDCQEKFKPENWDELQSKIQQWQQEGDKTTLSEEERIEINKAIIEYQVKINNAIKEEENRIVEMNIEKLSEESITKLLKHNDWQTGKLDEISILL